MAGLEHKECLWLCYEAAAADIVHTSGIGHFSLPIAKRNAGLTSCDAMVGCTCVLAFGVSSR